MDEDPEIPDEGAGRDTELAARFRAAFAYKGIVGPTPIGRALDVSDTTAKRLSRGDRLKDGESRFTRDLWVRVIELTGVPPWFAEHGWDGANVPDEISLAEEVQALRNQMDTVLAIIGTRAAAGAASATTQPGLRADPEDGTGKGPRP